MAKFKKGHKTVTARKPILKIHTRRESGRLKLFLRMERRDTLKPFARAIYEATTGSKIHGAAVIVFKDGNPANCRFSNLESVHRNELMRREIQHDESELTADNLNKIIEFHHEEIALVLEYFKKKIK